MVKGKKIIVDSIKDHLIPQVSSLNTPKEMFDSLNKLFEGNNINQKMTLRNQLRNVKIHNAEIVITTLNGLPISWDSFIKRICARRKRYLSADYGKNAHKDIRIKDSYYSRKDIRIKRESTHQTNKDKCSIAISCISTYLNNIVWLCTWLYSVDVLCMSE